MSSTTLNGRPPAKAMWISNGLRDVLHARPGQEAEKVANLRMILNQLGLHGDELPNRIARISIEHGGEELDCDRNDYETVRRFFELHRDDIPLARHCWLGELLTGLRIGIPIGRTDQRELNDLRRRIALKGRLP